MVLPPHSFRSRLLVPYFLYSSVPASHLQPSAIHLLISIYTYAKYSPLSLAIQGKPFLLVAYTMTEI